MRILLIVNSIFEIIVAFVMIFVPNVFLRGPDLSVSLARVLGCNALALGTLSWLMRDLTEPKQLRAGLSALSVFHVTVTISQFLNLLAGSTAPPVVIVHFLFAVSFLIVLWKQG